MSQKIHTFFAFLFAVLISVKSTGQATKIDYTQFSSTACNIFASSTNVANTTAGVAGTSAHLTNLGAPTYSSSSVELTGTISSTSGTIGTQYQIAYNFQSGHSYNISVDAEGVTFGNSLPQLQLKINTGGNGQNSTCNGAQSITAGGNDLHFAQGLPNAFGNPLSWNIATLTSSRSFLVVSIIPQETDLVEDAFIKSITITDNGGGTTAPPMPDFQLSPTSLSVACGDQSAKTFTVSNPNNVQGTLSYTWTIGNNWNNTGGGSATGTITSPSNVLTLQPAGGAAPGNVSVQVLVNGQPYKSYSCAVTFTTTTPTLSISSNTTANTVCSSAILTLSGALPNSSISWTTNPQGVVNLSPSPDGSQVTVNKTTDGSTTITATATNPCGNASVSYNLAVGVPVPNLTVDLSCPDAFGHVSNAQNGVFFTWSLNNSSGTQTFLGTADHHFGSISGNELVCVFYSNNCGTSTNECRPVFCTPGTGGHSIKDPLAHTADSSFTDLLNSDPGLHAFTVYPNPAKDHLVVTLPAEGVEKGGLAGIRSVSIYNGLGVLVNKYNYRDMPRSVNLVLKNLPQGIYLVKVEDGGKEKVKTIFIGK